MSTSAADDSNLPDPQVQYPGQYPDPPAELHEQPPPGIRWVSPQELAWWHEVQTGVDELETWLGDGE